MAPTSRRRLGDHGAPLALGLHLAGHGVGDIRRRRQVLDLDPRDLDAPGTGGVVDGREQAGVDRVALREDLVQLHGADHRAQIGLGQLGDGVDQIVDPIGGRRGVHHLDEDDRVDLDRHVILGDDLLLRDVQHLLHHVDLAADRLDERGQDADARLQGPGVAAEPLHGEFAPLGHDLDHADDQDERQDQQDQNNDRDAQDALLHNLLVEVRA